MQRTIAAIVAVGLLLEAASGGLLSQSAPPLGLWEGKVESQRGEVAAL